MNNTPELIPSPGTDNTSWQEIVSKIELVRPFVSTIHIDVVDGIFALNTTFSDPTPFAQHTKDLFFEVHLMTDNPIQYIKAWADVGFKRFIGQIEKMPDQDAFARKAREHGEAVLAIDATTSIHDITIPFEEFDGLLIMMIHAGFSGQEFLRPLLEKVRHLHRTGLPIEVDGGINHKNIRDAFDAGATRFVATSAIFGQENPENALKTLQSLLR